MNFSHLNFANNFVAMQQFTAATKVVGNIQQNVAYIPATSTQHYNPENNSNHINYPNNVQVSTAMIQQHYQEVAPRNHNTVSHSATSSTSTPVQAHWVDNAGNETAKVTLPCVTFKPQSRPISTSQHIQTDNSEIVKRNQSEISLNQHSRSNLITIERPFRTIIMKSVGTMTDFESTVLVDSKHIPEDSDDSSKSSTADNNSFSKSNFSNSCSKINLKSNTSALREYLNRLQPSSIPPDIQDFLQQHNIKVNLNKPELNPTDVKKEVDSSTDKIKPEIRISTALDGSLLYCCTECNMAYSAKDQLDLHLIGHKEERKFECNVCGVCLKRKEHLDQHKRGHSEERPFVCEICYKGFKRNEHLRRHIVIHSGDKNYVCTHCGKAFSRKDHLTKHHQTHYGKRLKPESEPTSPSPLYNIQPHNNIKHPHDNTSKHIIN